MVTEDPARIERLFAGARLFIDRALRSDDSVLTPGAPIWTARHADELGRVSQGEGLTWARLRR